MVRTLSLFIAVGCAAAPPPSSSPSQSLERSGIDAFNLAMVNATRRMDAAAIAALWEDDGVSLLPSTSPTVGKPAIRTFIEAATVEHPGARIVTFEMTCDGVEVVGDFAHEYCDEHQLVDLGSGKSPFEGWGRMLFVLHRGGDHVWRLRREMWQPARAPQT